MCWPFSQTMPHSGCKKNSPFNTILKTNWDVFFSKLTMFWNSDFSPLTILKKKESPARKTQVAIQSPWAETKTSFKNQQNNPSNFPKKTKCHECILSFISMDSQKSYHKNKNSTPPHLTPPPATRWAYACDAAAAAAASPVLRRRARRRGRRTSSCRSRSRAWRPAPWHQ